MHTLLNTPKTTICVLGIKENTSIFQPFGRKVTTAVHFSHPGPLGQWDTLGLSPDTVWGSQGAKASFVSLSLIFEANVMGAFVHFNPICVYKFHSGFLGDMALCEDRITKTQNKMDCLRSFSHLSIITTSLFLTG